MSRPQLRAVALSPFVRQKLGTFLASENSDDLTVLRGLLESAAVVPANERTCPLRETAAAIRQVQDGHARGKIVISVS